MTVAESVEHSGPENPYHVGKELGRGGFGVVHSCTDTRTGEIIACKIVERENESSHGDIEREIRLMRQLNKMSAPGVVVLKDTFEHRGKVYLIMELAHGGDLHKYICRQPDQRLEEPIAAGILVQVVQALDFLHRHARLIHRDLKPKNILLLERPTYLAGGTWLSSPIFKAGKKERSDIPTVKIADFGRAMVLNEGELATGLVTTYPFMPPEAIPIAGREHQDVGRQYGMSADIWSLGVTLHLMLSGEMPFPYLASNDALLRSIADGHVALGSPRWADVSPSAKDLVTRMLNYDPAKRLTATGILAHPWLQTTRDSPPNPPPLPALHQKASAPAPPPPSAKKSRGSFLGCVQCDTASPSHAPTQDPPPPRPPTPPPPTQAVQLSIPSLTIFSGPMPACPPAPYLLYTPPSTPSSSPNSKPSLFEFAPYVLATPTSTPPASPPSPTSKPAAQSNPSPPPPPPATSDSPYSPSVSYLPPATPTPIPLYLPKSSERKVGVGVQRDGHARKAAAAAAAEEEEEGGLRGKKNDVSVWGGGLCGASVGIAFSKQTAAFVCGR